MTKSPNAFRSIGEVARLVGVATHVLRYWETQFTALSPVKRPDGRRYYRPDDVLLAAGICEILREEGLTIRGARRLIAQDRGAALRARGRLRLGDRLGLEPGGAEPAPTPAKSARTQKTPAPARDDAPPAPAVRPRRTAVETAHLPLFPELEPAADPESTVTYDTAMDARLWLARLSATAAALRTRQTPLPDTAEPLRAALRRARDGAIQGGIQAAIDAGSTPGSARR